MNDAKQSADDTVPKVKEGLQRAAAELVYDLAYATQFASTVVKSIVSDTAADASQKGATAGSEAAQEFLRKRGATPETTEKPVSDATAPNDEAGPST